MAEWFVAGGFGAAAVAVGDPDNIVCLKVHGMRFNIPAQKGDILEITAKVVAAGTTSITVHNQTLSTKTGKVLVEGFITFVNVDSNGNKKPHGIILENLTEEELELQKQVRELK